MYSDLRVTPQSIENSRNDSFLRKPSTLKSAGVSFAETFTAPVRAVADVTASINGLPAKNFLDNSFEVFNESMKTPHGSWTQSTVDFFASGIGYLNPMYEAIGGPVSGAVGRGFSAVSQYVPAGLTAIARTPIARFGGKLGEYLPNTVGEAAEHVTKAFGIGAAITVPEALLDSYNEKTNRFEIAVAASQTFTNGLIGIALDAIPVVGGMIFGKHKKRFQKEYESPMPGDDHRMAAFDEALEKKEITPEEHEWVKTYLENPNDTQKLKDKGIELLLKDGYPVDHAQQKVIMNLMKKEHFDDFHTGMLDQISSGATGEFSASISDYAAASGIDFMVSENKDFVDGINGFVEFMEKRLATEPDNIKRFKEARKSPDLKHIEENHPISQKGLYNELKAVNHDIQSVPHGIPKNVRYRAKQEREISKLKTDISRLKKLAKRDPAYESKIDEKSARLRELKSTKEKLLSPNNELKALEDHFLDRKLLPENYNVSHEYHRLLDLAHFSTKAEALLHHINLKSQYEQQTHYKDTIKFLNQLIESNVGKFANPENVVNYFKSRLDSVGTDIDELVNHMDVRNQREVPIEHGRGAYSDVKKRDELKDFQRDLKDDVRNDEEILKANQADVDASGSLDYEKLYRAAKEKYTQFKGNEAALSQLISCELGNKGIA